LSESIERVNEEQVPNITLSRYVVVQIHDESIGRKEDVRIEEENENEDVGVQKDDESIDEEEDYSTLGKIPPLF